jgi:hypothetical protein
MSLDEPDAGQARGASLMDGVLGVSSAGLVLNAGTATQDAALIAELHCETEAQCTAVRTLLLKQRLSLSGNFGARLIGFGPLIDAFEASVQGTTLVASTHPPAGDGATSVERMLSRARPKPSPTPPALAPPSPPLAPKITPDESLVAKPDASDAHLALPASKP